jgi:hypothetical protein
VRVPEALAALKLKLDMSQMTGNGSGTRLNFATAAAVPKTDTTKAQEDPIEMRFKQAKLEQQEAINRKIAEEEKARAGVYMLADEARAEAAKLAGQLLQAFEGGLNEMAAALAAEYKLPQRDVVHTIRAQFALMRERITQKMRSGAAAESKYINAADVQQ